MIGIYGSEKASETVLTHLSWLGGYNEKKLLATVEYDVYFVEDGIIKSMTKNGFIEKYKSEPYTIEKWQEIHNEFSFLHKKIVEDIIKFADKNNLDITDFNINADGISKVFYKFGWHPGIDSSFKITNKKETVLWSI
jgi:hypothetical protein